MPLRVLQHGFSGATESVGLEPGRWSDVAAHGQFLLDLEFDTEHTRAAVEDMCMVFHQTVRTLAVDFQR